MGILRRLVEEYEIHATVARLTADPDPEPSHAYVRDSWSGAGNCTCGAAEAHRRHPHWFTSSRSDTSRCVCGLLAGARCHG
jgi:hypothetical protein